MHFIFLMNLTQTLTYARTDDPPLGQIILKPM